MTDHRIQRRPPGDLLTPRVERSTLTDTAFRGEVTSYYPATAMAPEDELYFAMAQVVQGANLKGGIERLRSLIETQRPSERGFYFELGAAYEQIGEFTEASAWFEQALQMDPSFALARRRLGVASSQAGEFSRADEVLCQADQSDPETLKELGLNAARAGNFQNAIDVMRRAIALDADLPELHNNLGGALGAINLAAEAEVAIREAVRLQPDLAEARFNLGNLLAAKGETAEAEIHWKQAIRSRPDYAEARYNYAIILAQSERYAEARDQLKAALKADSSFSAAKDILDQLDGLR